MHSTASGSNPELLLLGNEKLICMIPICLYKSTRFVAVSRMLVAHISKTSNVTSPQSGTVHVNQALTLPPPLNGTPRFLDLTSPHYPHYKGVSHVGLPINTWDGGGEGKGRRDPTDFLTIEISMSRDHHGILLASTCNSLDVVLFCKVPGQLFLWYLWSYDAV